jgi:hypothetical protein
VNASPFEHERYERICALVAVGEASLEELQEFETHAQVCAECRCNVRDYHKLFGALFPEARLEWPCVTEAVEDRLSTGKRKLIDSLEAESPAFAHASSPPDRRVWITAGAIAALIALSVLIGRNYGVPAKSQERAAVPAASAPMIERSVEKPSPIAGEAGRTEDRRHLGELDTAMGELRAERDRLLNELESARRDQSAAEKRAQDLESARLHTSKADLESAYAELEARVRSQEAFIARQQRLLAVDREVHNVLGSPNLRVLDVQSVASTGEVERAFGRVFYAPGTALVLYAFDLDEHAGDKFDVWGSSGVKMAGGRRLGVLEMDRREDNRWVLKYEDRNQLAQIDTVYVVAADSGPPAPMKPILRAYLSVPELPH